MREVKRDEHRVALTPAGALELTRAGHEVLIEHGAGAGSAFEDREYLAVGARLAEVDDVWRDAQLLLKVKEPQPNEYGRLRRGQVLFTYLHLASDAALTGALLHSGVTAVGYETVETDDGRLPLLAPMSEIAGRLATQAGAVCLERPHGGRGTLLGGAAGVAPGSVVVLGGGVVGYHAALIALGMGARVTIIERSLDRIRHLAEILGGRATLVVSSTLQIQQAVALADLVIGAVLIPGGRAPLLLTEEMIRGMRRGSVVVDVAIDQGGCFATSHATTHSDPTYVVHGVVHYCVSNMPGCVPSTSTQALVNSTLPYIHDIADRGIAEAARLSPALRRGINTAGGRLTHAAVAEAQGLGCTAPLDALAGVPLAAPGAG